jgi:hypothetical protein
MSENYQRNSAINAAANVKVHHARITDLSANVARKMYRGGVRSGEPSRSTSQATEMVNKIPPSQRAGIDGKSAGSNAQEYLVNKHASHIKPHSKGASNNPRNIKWEDAKQNIVRGDKPMTWQEQMRLNAKWHFDNLTGAVKAGIKAAPLGAAVGAATTAPFSMLTNALRVIRGEISAQEAVIETVKDTVVGGTVGGVTAFTVTTIAAACPPIAIALTAVAPALTVVGTAGMVYEFFNILENHKQEVKFFYESLTHQELEHLQAIENELIYEHHKNLEFIAEAKAVNQTIKNRPVKPGIEAAIKRYQESVAIAQSLGLTSTDSPLLGNSVYPSLPLEK